MPVTGSCVCPIANVLGLWLDEEETVAPGDDGPDRKAEETGLGQTAAEGWGALTALAHLHEDWKTNQGYEL